MCHEWHKNIFCSNTTLAIYLENCSPVVFTTEKVLQCRQKNKKGDNVIEDQGIYNESFSFNLAHVHLIVQYLLLQSGSAILKKISGLEKCSASFEFSDWLRHFFSVILRGKFSL